MSASCGEIHWMVDEKKKRMIRVDGKCRVVVDVEMKRWGSIGVVDGLLKNAGSSFRRGMMVSVIHFAAVERYIEAKEMSWLMLQCFTSYSCMCICVMYRNGATEDWYNLL